MFIQAILSSDMKEKRFLYMILFIMFLLLTVLTLLILEGKVREKQRFGLMEYDKLMYRFYQSYLNGDDLNEEMTSEIAGFGLYNFYGDPLFRYGSSVTVIRDEFVPPFFDRKDRTVVILRDFLNPFMPVSREKTLFEGVTSRIYNNALAETEENKQRMIRYVYMVVKDEYFYGLLILFRGLQVVFTLAYVLIIGLIGKLYLHNLTYRKQIEEQERLVMLGVAARTLTHEIKNPLSSIRLQSSIIERSGCTLHEVSLKIINEEVERLSLLSERVGDFLRNPMGNREPADLSLLTMKNLERYSGRIALPGAEDLPPMPILIDPDRYRSILDNLINNAIESGSPSGDIRVSLEKKGHEAVLTVSDRGNGITSEDMEKLFDPYFTTKSRGSGVGLSIVQNFVKALDGQIHIRSDEGEGTSVLIRLPLDRNRA